MNAKVFQHPGVMIPIAGSTQVFPVRRAGRSRRERIREPGNDEREPPFFFATHRDCILRNGAKNAYPGLTSNYRHEPDLAAAMKSGGGNIKKEDALGRVFGYAVGLNTRTMLERHARSRPARYKFLHGENRDLMGVKELDRYVRS